ncbi:secretion/DNA translocation related CpaE-like protein [Kitasatospora sp. SolWspMP-SS2h]|uniref:septum site-determining protein Ssd n=1 Tax=Kitasatospora sp. SolWspMP-SS2h TaxID=1305729 RepID=UPI000DBA865F|nr:septum site-determining protein Ssd [Kitasatospora sp. SolWspMP-SS2h]RAJ42302.1 secretion/DNA translocation related CpaE-like protein [Kitasatospora sp. SolWspMP-SS2h]
MSASVTDPHATAPEPPPGPLVLTGDAALAEQLTRLCAAAGAEPRLLGVPPPARLWADAPLVLVGDDLAEQCAGLARRPGVLLLGLDLDDGEVWVRAVRLGAEHVLFLPDAQPWLLDRIADATEGVGPPALTVAVLGGRGGAGASTLACALAVCAARAGHRTMLIDGDPLGGGLDVLLGAEQAGGLRWPDLAASRGRISGTELAKALPEPHRLSTLSWDRSDTLAIPAEAMRSVLAAARRRGGLVVLDLPRQLDAAAAQALEQSDTGLLVVPAELRALAAADRVAAAVRIRLTDLRAVVRTPGPSGLTAADVARGLHLRLAGELAPEPGLALDVERGTPPGLRERGPLARFCGRFLTEAMPPVVAA